MKSDCLLTVPFGERVFLTEVCHNRKEDLVAIGLSGSIAIIKLLFDESNPNETNVEYEVVHSISHDTRVQCLAWSPETTLAVAPRCLKFATGGKDHNVRIFSSDLGQNESVRVLKGHKDYVNTLTYHPEDNGGQLVSGSDDHTVALWDSNTGQHLHTVTFDSPVMKTMWHPEEVSKLMIAEKNGVIHIFNIVSYHPILSLDYGMSPLLTADWSLSNSLMIVAAVRSQMTVFDISKMAPVMKKNMLQDIVKEVKIAPFSDNLVATAGQPNYSVKISSTRNNQMNMVMEKEPIAGMSWHPRRNILVVGHDEKISLFHVMNKHS